MKRVVRGEAGEVVVNEIERLDSKETVKPVNLLNAIIVQVEIRKSSSAQCQHVLGFWKWATYR